MNSHKGVSRTLLKDFDSIEETDPKAEPQNSNNRSMNVDFEPTDPTPQRRDYETRNRATSNSYRESAGKVSRTALKPRQENSLGELTKKFITLIKATDDY
jgi:hypothetical protein